MSRTPRGTNRPALSQLVVDHRTPAATAVYADLVDHWLPRVIALVALGSFVALAFAFTSLVIPLKAVAPGPAVIRLAGRWNWWPGSAT